MNKLPFTVGIAIAAGSVLPMPFAETEQAYAEQPRVCVDVNGGPIDASDPINTIEIQRAIGAETDGVFGTDTCRLVWTALISAGILEGTGTTLKIGEKVHNWLGAPMPTATERYPLPPSDNESDILLEQQDTACPTAVKNSGEISAPCMQEAKGRLYNMGFVDDSTARAVKAFQIEAGVTPKGGAGYGVLGPKTYTAIMGGTGLQTINASPELGSGFVVDISDQTIKYYKNGALVVGALISSGVTGAETRLGNKSIYRSRTDADGWVRSSLQDLSDEPAMYMPFYFDGGQAIHGTRRLDKLGMPASKGCTRLAPGVVDILIQKGLLKKGARVLVQA